jgi:LytR cell envelope-related transcriptional attenuator
MSGRHQPPSNRSFYLSLATSTLRAAIVIALVVGGIFVINSAFPETGVSGGGASPSGAEEPTGPTDTDGPTGPTDTDGPTGTTGQEPEVVDMAVAVRNGTSVSGLAGDTAKKLEDRFGVNAIQVDDAPSTVSLTTIYFRGAGQEDEAELLAAEFFKKIEPKIARLEAGSGVERDVQIAIYLGTDYASAKS